MQKRITILGTPLSLCSRDEAQGVVRDALQTTNDSGTSTHQTTIVTPNPEMLVDATRNQSFAHALAGATLQIPDGTGLIFAAKFLGTPLIERITGTDFLADILHIAAESKKRVYFLGAKDDTATRAASKLQQTIPGWQLVGAENGGEKIVDASGTPQIDAQLTERIRAAAPDILFIAWGHPYQELWMHRALPQLPSVKVAMGVGGAFDFYAGNVRRAPKIFRTLGIEWLWRLILQPWRIKRIFKAVIVFPWLVISRKS